MVIAQRLDEYGKPAWIAVMVLGFILFWPIGLAILGYMYWSGRMGCSGKGRWGRWKSGSCQSSSRNWQSQSPDSGNSAFEEYKTETLKRLEDEQQEFLDYLERLRQAKDKAEFEQFMTERRRRSYTPPAGPDPQEAPA